MTLEELRDKICEILKDDPGWAKCDRICVVTNVEKDTGWKDME